VVDCVESGTEVVYKTYQIFIKHVVDEHLLKLGNERLELHYLRMDLLTCYKILHHFVDTPQVTLGNVKITQSNTFELIVPNFGEDEFFSVRSIIVWNRLSEEILNYSSISTFYDKLI